MYFYFDLVVLAVVFLLKLCYWIWFVSVIVRVLLLLFRIH